MTKQTEVKACSECKKSHLKCSGTRPCTRCVRLKKECLPVLRKQRVPKPVPPVCPQFFTLPYNFNKDISSKTSDRFRPILPAPIIDPVHFLDWVSQQQQLEQQQQDTLIESTPVEDGKEWDELDHFLQQIDTPSDTSTLGNSPLNLSTHE